MCSVVPSDMMMHRGRSFCQPVCRSFWSKGIRRMDEKQIGAYFDRSVTQSYLGFVEFRAVRRVADQQHLVRLTYTSTGPRSPSLIAHVEQIIVPSLLFGEPADHGRIKGIIRRCQGRTCFSELSIKPSGIKVQRRTVSCQRRSQFLSQA